MYLDLLLLKRHTSSVNQRNLLLVLSSFMIVSKKNRSYPSAFKGNGAEISIGCERYLLRKKTDLKGTLK